MKKTKQTLMTAAMFAAAINMSAYANSGNQNFSEMNVHAEESETSYEPSEEPIQDVYGPPTMFEAETTTNTVTTVPATVYGPPWWFTTSTEEETVTTSSEEIVPETTTTYYQPETTIYNPSTETTVVPVYGPPVAYGGDINHDGRTDAFDIVTARQKLINRNYYDDYTSDVNGDGKFSVADLVALEKFVLGEIKDVTEYNPDIEPVYGVYGPMPDYSSQDTTTTAVPDTDTTE